MRTFWTSWRKQLRRNAVKSWPQGSFFCTAMHLCTGPICGWKIEHFRFPAGQPSPLPTHLSWSLLFPKLKKHLLWHFWRPICCWEVVWSPTKEILFERSRKVSLHQVQVHQFHNFVSLLLEKAKNLSAPPRMIKPLADIHSVTFSSPIFVVHTPLSLGIEVASNDILLVVPSVHVFQLYTESLLGGPARDSREITAVNCNCCWDVRVPRAHSLVIWWQSSRPGF